MNRKWLGVVVGVLLVGLLAIPVYAAMTTKRYTVPPEKNACVECRGRNTGLWMMRISPRKAIFKCVKVSLRKGGGDDCSFYFDASFQLQRGERLIVKAGGDEKRYLRIYNYGPHNFEIYNW